MALSTVGIVSVTQYKQLATYTVTTSDPYFTKGNIYDTCASSLSLSLYLSHWMSYCQTVATVGIASKIFAIFKESSVKS